MNNGKAVHEYTRAEIIREIDQGSRARLGIPATKLIGDYKRGKLVDPGAVADILILAGLLSKKDPLYAEM